MTPIGAIMTADWYMGRLFKTTLTSTILPARLSQLKPQEWILSLNFSNNDNQSLLRALFWKTGSPKYLKEVQDEEAAKPKQLEIAWRNLGEEFQQ